MKKSIALKCIYLLYTKYLKSKQIRNKKGEKKLTNRDISKIDDIKLVPILVGSTTEVKERMYGGLLAKYLEDPENLFIISSDFCHW